MAETFVEIGQDGAGVIETGCQGVSGFLTVDVESCVVFVFVCEHATILVHDSAQLKLDDITRLVQQYGAVRGVLVLYGPDKLKLHDDRYPKLLAKLGLSEDQVETAYVPWANFSVIYRLDGTYEDLDKFRASLLSTLPEKAQRQAVSEINNFFQPRNAQALALDVQYREGAYQKVRGPDPALDTLLDILKREPGLFFHNLAVLMGGHRAGVLMLPTALFAFGEQYELDRFRFQRLGSQDEIQQEYLFQKFRDNQAEYLKQ